MCVDILVVDDEVAIADLVEVYLTNENYRVHKFYDAEEALHCIESTKLDLAILDVCSLRSTVLRCVAKSANIMIIPSLCLRPKWRKGIRSTD